MKHLIKTQPALAQVFWPSITAPMAGGGDCQGGGDINAPMDGGGD